MKRRILAALLAALRRLGGGGGRPDMAQAGGKKAEALPQAFEKAAAVIEAQLG